MKKQKKFYQNSKKLIVSSVTAAALGLLSISNSKTVKADSLFADEATTPKQTSEASQPKTFTITTNTENKTTATKADDNQPEENTASQDDSSIQTNDKVTSGDSANDSNSANTNNTGAASNSKPTKPATTNKPKGKTGLSGRAVETIDDWMPDKNLQMVVAENLGKDIDQITKQDVAGMTELTLNNIVFNIDSNSSYVAKYKQALQIKSLTGLENAINLETLDLSPDTNANLTIFNQILVNSSLSDISALAPLTKLKNITLQFCNINDISALANKPELVNLSISYNHITDFSPLKDSPNLSPYTPAYYQSGDYPVQTIAKGTKSITLNYNVTDIDGSPFPLRVANIADAAHDNYVRNYLSDSRVPAAINGQTVTWDLSNLKPGDHGYLTINYRGKFLGASGYPSGGWIIIPFQITTGEPVVIHYQDDQGKSLSSDLTLTGNIGAVFNTDNYIKDIKGYHLVGANGNRTGAISDKPQEVTYIYAANDGEPVVVHYVDEHNNTIASDVTLTGKYNEDFQTEQKDLTGYTFKEVHGSTTGKFSNQKQDVTYVYTANDGEPVTVHYQDDQGKQIAPDVNLNGKYNEDFNTETDPKAGQKKLTGYTFKEVRGSTAGKFSDQKQEVTYIYTANDGEPVVVHYVDENNNTIAPDVTLNGKYNEDFNTDTDPKAGKKKLTGYTYKEVRGNTAGKFSDQKQEVTYVYSQNPIIPTNPTKPENPIKPDKPSNPTKPGKPTKPNKPSKPNKPDKPTKPNKPGKPTKPNKPGKPTKPNKPSKPTKPNKPGKPTKPNKPGKSSISTTSATSPKQTSISDPTTSANSTKQANTLPQTGVNKHSNIALLALGGLIFLVSLVEAWLDNKNKK